MDPCQPVVAYPEPPSPLVAETSFPARAWGLAADRYWALLEALFDGLREYDARKGGLDHAPAPLPVA